MKIFFAIPKGGLDTLEKTYKKIIEELKREKVSVITQYEKNYLNKEPRLKPIKDLVFSEDEYRYAHDTAVRKAIFRCDAVVVEASYPSFRLGFETFFALSQQKPVLVLSKIRNYGHLVDQPHFFGAKYTGFTLPDEIKKFIKHVREYKLRNRFNLFISDNHKDYLEKAAKQYGISMSDYVRKLIDNDAGKNE